ncbi:hypothetical protein GUITHDRAFT_111600 [Guillardia theta CCMP2712]|uniref:Hydroxylysine kinase n=1 Tax=Guillardia theta (strain CCMP2712) TaxID=905079 RepID=L1J2L7_GUITC|nr:hypothetical protein GUITHDRAFT_111600 [Guillardia theta CCMP2712]EKX42325.1 hypothetical protein GUITHDRAFT_111600 [Guillardia theta CCMP2712]|eukprot:XP_005829305.1 hypothetical protein GUITHDRAFT_111600 [Guillardia theta CCMP2712]
MKSQEVRRKEQKPAKISVDDVLRHAREVFGVVRTDQTHVDEFDSYDDRNFFLSKICFANEPDQYVDVVMKIHNGVESDNLPLVVAQNDVLSYLSLHAVDVPLPIKTADNTSCVGCIILPCISGSDSRQHAVRLLQYIPGSIIGQREEESPALLQDIGRYLEAGWLAYRCPVLDYEQPLSRRRPGLWARWIKSCLRCPKSLRELLRSSALVAEGAASALKERDLLWDLKNVPSLSSFSEFIKDEGRRALQREVIRRFEEKVSPKMESLRKAVIQNDANEQNILIDQDRRRVQGIIDFGDCTYTCLIFELAICMAYLMLGKKDILTTATHIYAGYNKEVSLTQDEKEILHCLICSRLVQSLTLGAYSFSKDPTNEYLLVTAQTGWVALEALMAIREDDFLKRMEEGV